MPIPSTPKLFPNVLGYAADVTELPDATPAGQGIPSFRDLFPFITQVDPDAGGVMVERVWMNALFNLLGQHVFFQQSGCIYPWQATLNYIAGSHVKGSDDVEYIALQPSGPDVSGTGAKDPAQQANRAYWVSLASFVSDDIVPNSRRVIAGTGLTGGGPLSADVTLAAKLTDSVNLADSTTAASAKAAKVAYARGTEALNEARQKVSHSRRVIAGTGLTGGGPLSSDVTLSAKLDGKTTQAAADGAITVKDVAIGGAASDLASARGIFYTQSKGSVDCNTLTDQGVYAITLRGTVNGPGFPAKLIVFNGINSKLTNQMALAIDAGTSGAVRVAYRARNSEEIWSTWSEGILSGRIGDGITVNNGIISVPEYEGATSSADGVSGLVPAATAGQQESFLTGGGEYKPALSTSGGTITGELNIAAPAGGSEGGEITLINGTDGKYPAKINTTRNLIRFFGGPSNPVSVDLETGRFVGNLTGKADTAGIADSALAFANGRRWVEVIYEGNPGWLIGSVNEELRPVNPSSLNVNYANSAGYANARFLNTFAFATANTGVNLPAGGTWLVFAQWYSYGGDYWEVSGKQGPWINYRAGGSRIEEQRLGFALRIS